MHVITALGPSLTWYSFFDPNGLSILGLRLRSSLSEGLASRAALIQKLWSRQGNPDISR